MRVSSASEAVEMSTRTENLRPRIVRGLYSVDTAWFRTPSYTFIVIGKALAVELLIES